MLRPERIEQPLTWKKSKMIFVNSMSDLFHKEVPKDFIDKVFTTMEKADWHIFQVLTKRSSLMMKYVNARYKNSKAPRHIWLGTSVEDKRSCSRIKHIQNMSANIKFLSVEPLLQSIGNADLSGIQWVIVGGESGPKARPIEAEWVREIRNQCKKKKIPFFFKQWGGFRPKAGGRELDGRTWDQYPFTLEKYISSRDKAA